MTWCHIEDKERTARKEHKCFICCRPIKPKTKYVERTGVDGGEHIHMRMHPACEEYSHDWDTGDWESFATGDLGDLELEDIDAIESAGGAS